MAKLFPWGQLQALAPRLAYATNESNETWVPPSLRDASAASASSTTLRASASLPLLGPCSRIDSMNSLSSAAIGSVAGSRGETMSPVR